MSRFEDCSIHRRAFMSGIANTGAILSLSGGTYVTGTGTVRLDPVFGDEFETVAANPGDATQHWLGPGLWGNRLQDWKHEDGKIVCLQSTSGHEIRTVALLTREIVAGDTTGHLRVTTGLAGVRKHAGFCGFLIGVNEELDYRARALAQRSSGKGGGMLCTFEMDGQVRFRDHTDERRPLEFRELSSETHAKMTAPQRPTTDDDFELALDIFPRPEGRFDVRLNVHDANTGRYLAGAPRQNVAEKDVLGGISLVSSPPSRTAGTRWWFQGVETAGDKIAVHPERQFGPIAGTMYSQSAGVLKLTTQLLPVGDENGRLRLNYRPFEEDATWRKGPTATVESGYVARFRVEEWDATRDWEYLVTYRDSTGVVGHYRGRIRAEPSGENLTIALFSCVAASARRLDSGSSSRGRFDKGRLGRYTPENLYFPHESLVSNAGAHDPDLLVFAGDQLYQSSPTRASKSPNPDLDYLYKWYLWVWAFRDLTRSIPSITLVDDHDVYQSNLWGARGRRDEPHPYEDAIRRGQREQNIAEGGYVCTPSFVKQVQRVQCGHNPDPYSIRSIAFGIPVYYTDFVYGGVNFALLEDRKFKSPPPARADPNESLELLGEQQERFLSDWAERIPRNGPAICLTQTCFAAAHTGPGGRPERDYDANGYPASGRNRAIRLLRDANALVLSGDQHLATLIRHGVDQHTDGIVQFNGPAGGTTFQRWFEPKPPLPNGTGHPNTGDFTDAFGNKLRVLAVANPTVSYATFRRFQQGHHLYRRQHKREGYGIVHVDRDAEEFVIECWPWDEDPLADEASQYTGWPYRLPFSEVRGESPVS